MAKRLQLFGITWHLVGKISRSFTVFFSGSFRTAEWEGPRSCVFSGGIRHHQIPPFGRNGRICVVHFFQPSWPFANPSIFYHRYKTRWWQLKDFWNFHSEPWGDDPIWRAYFSNGLVQPPTRKFWEMIQVDLPIIHPVIPLEVNGVFFLYVFGGPPSYHLRRWLWMSRVSSKADPNCGWWLPIDTTTGGHGKQIWTASARGSGNQCLAPVANPGDRVAHMIPTGGVSPGVGH